MNNVISQVENLINTAVGGSPIVHYVSIVLLALFGIIYCLYGFKLVRVVATVLGAMIGCAVGYEITVLAKLTFPISAAVVAVCALIFGLLGFFLRRLGIFVVIFCGAFLAVVSLVTEYTSLDSLIVAIIALVAGVVLAILSVIYGRPVIIIASALIGGMMFSHEIFEHLVQIRWDSQIEMYARLGAGAVFSLIGIIFQFLKTRHKG